MRVVRPTAAPVSSRSTVGVSWWAAIQVLSVPRTGLYT
jgi:hypothetical protein